jgi:hypothetical protein
VERGEALASFLTAMLDLLDLLLPRRGIPPDHRTLAFRCIDGNARFPVIYFLPWHTPYGFARQPGIAPLDFPD